MGPKIKSLKCLDLTPISLITVARIGRVIKTVALRQKVQILSFFFKASTLQCIRIELSGSISSIQYKINAQRKALAGLGK
jgi:hypothetical protein